MTLGRMVFFDGHGCGGRLTAMIPTGVLLCLALFLFTVSCRPPGKDVPEQGGVLYPEEILSAAERRQEIAEKEYRVQEWLRREKLSAVLLSSPHNFAWITGGGSRRLDPLTPCSAPLLIRDDGRKFIFDRGRQSDHILAEEMQSLGYEVKRAGWFDDQRDSEPAEETLKDLVEGRSYASDQPRAYGRLAGNEIAALRVPLTEWEVSKYRWLGRSCAGAVDSVCRRMERWWTDRGIEALLYEDLVRRAIRPLEVHVEADTEVQGAEARKVANYASVRVSASRWGLVVEMKRAVHFGPLSPALGRQQENAARVAAGLWARTVPGSTAGAILEGAIADYANVGLPDDWHRGSPGGMIGYTSREWEATPGAQDQIRQSEAFAWNAAVGDFATEDTVLLDGDRLVIITEIPGWPVIESRALGRIYRIPAILQKDL